MGWRRKKRASRRTVLPNVLHDFINHYLRHLWSDRFCWRGTQNDLFLRWFVRSFGHRTDTYILCKQAYPLTNFVLLLLLLWFRFFLGDFSEMSKKRHVPLSVLSYGYSRMITSNTTHSSISLSAMIYNNRFQLRSLIKICTVIHIDRQT